MKILVTGSTGFIGRELTRCLLDKTDAILHLSVRNNGSKEVNQQTNNPRVIYTQIGDISPDVNWCESLVDCEVVIHTAARAHIIVETAADPMREFMRINVDGTLNLAKQAVISGVKRFIFISSIGVNGESTCLNRSFSSVDFPNPNGSYAKSKYEAEQGLIKLAEKSQMEVVIIRPPLAYGPGVKGNFLRMMQLLHKRVPLPFGALGQNKRSFVSVSNLVDLIKVCISHPLAANQIFLVSDNDDISTTDLSLKIRKLLGNRAPLVPVPLWFLNGVATLLGKEGEMKRLGSSLQVDISKSRELLNWEPIESMDEALYKTVHDYMHKNMTTCI